ncbi:hypothetical protein [Roseibium sp. MMSF_3544]|uniref:hypothetical protein n=1 Tax=unclassified Roseibium TaxID=2629323 RepID=UPI00273D21B8|nr:hypothetical protein [Roseibium sp. MMSF_3544]
MTDTLSLGWSEADARKKRDGYVRLLGINLALQSLIALWVLIYPWFFLSVLGLESDAAGQWARVWAAMVLMASAFQLPGLIDPLTQRLPCVVGVIGRAFMAVVFLCLGGGFIWLALFDGIFAILLFLAFQRAVISELQTRP